MVESAIFRNVTDGQQLQLTPEVARPTLIFGPLPRVPRGGVARVFIDPCPGAARAARGTDPRTAPRSAADQNMLSPV